ncbi:hypothetical protein LBMAG33_3260 [Candidatus Levyibacteriota bacterium]|nr:hypothetical protein LBMAG33_3260 [Candidatus Levybacteria bacterium]
MNIFDKLIIFITKYKRIPFFRLSIIIIILIGLPVTVFVMQQRQDIRQRAQNVDWNKIVPNDPSDITLSCIFNNNIPQLLAKWQNPTYDSDNWYYENPPHAIIKYQVYDINNNNKISDYYGRPYSTMAPTTGNMALIRGGGLGYPITLNGTYSFHIAYCSPTGEACTSFFNSNLASCPSLVPTPTLRPTSTPVPTPTPVPCPYRSTDVFFSFHSSSDIPYVYGWNWDVNIYNPPDPVITVDTDKWIRVAGFHNFLEDYANPFISVGGYFHGFNQSSRAPSDITLYITSASGNYSLRNDGDYIGTWFTQIPGTYTITAKTDRYEEKEGCFGGRTLIIVEQIPPPAPIISTSPPSVPSPSTSTLTLSIHLIGIGKGTYKYSGIGFNASIPDNPNPINRNRELEISKYSGNSCSIGIPGIDSNVFTYDKYSGKFVGNINLSPGTYCLKLNLPYYLNEEVVITIPASTTAINRSIELKPGDLDSDNDIDQNDVNLWEANYIMGSPERGLEYDINDNSVLQILIDETFIQVGARGGGGY